MLSLFRVWFCKLYFVKSLQSLEIINFHYSDLLKFVKEKAIFVVCFKVILRKLKNQKKHLMNDFAITTVNVNLANCMQILVYTPIKYLKHKICKTNFSLNICI